ncbi:hypothetical protein ET445_09255 [Agromyces protaetiae]|uniref:Uncharacterized protein n=1 Tax=Agromyces protaetiae TaxID=2509455 RepID=A0A4P6FBW2_9MICO|nr:DUF6264 family protein [Agromyces protaetiae]QAY73492.1 hypothetical protein ET445_09255 [Agromyces protaetiae]
MSRDEAAQTPAPEAGSGQNQAVPPQVPADERPRPRYGEYAPPGWTWTPPQEAATEASASTADANADRPASPWGATAQPAPSAAPGAPAGRSADRSWTTALLVFGVLGALYNTLSLISAPGAALQAAQTSASMLGLDGPTSFTPGPAVPFAIGVGVALQIVLWVGAMLWSRARIRAGRLAWWVPLLAGAVAFVVVVIVQIIVFASDPDFFATLTQLPT